MNLVTQDNVWSNEQQLTEIRKTYAPTLSQLEFSAFIQLGRATGLNPFMKELWAVKYASDRPASIFIGRDGYRKAAQRQADYDYHLVDAVYSNDKFSVINGEVHHERKFGQRGALLGAYAVGKRTTSSRSMYVTVEMKEYDKNFGLWKTHKETMIKKTAEAQLLRQLFQEVFVGTYSDAEAKEPIAREAKAQLALDTIKERMQSNETKAPTATIDNTNQTGANNYPDEPPARPREILEASSTENESIRNETNLNPITKEQKQIIKALIKEKNLGDDRKATALHYYKVKAFDELTESQAIHFINMLDKV